MLKIFVFAPNDKTDELINAMAEAGVGVIGNYTHNAFISSGFGNWKSGTGSHPYTGKVGEMSREPENRIEMICPEEKLKEVKKTIKRVHPYETPAIDVLKLDSVTLH